jgi:hypothetical protein
MKAGGSEARWGGFSAPVPPRATPGNVNGRSRQGRRLMLNQSNRSDRFV